MDILNGVSVVVINPEDKVIVSFDTNIHDTESATTMFNALKNFFPKHDVIRIFGAEIKFIKEEKNETKDQIEKYFSSL